MTMRHLLSALTCAFLLWGGHAAAAPPKGGIHSHENFAPEAFAKWIDTSVSRPVFGIKAPENTGVELTAKVRMMFGHLQYKYVMGPFKLRAGERRRVILDLPPQAAQHERVDTYASDLLVRVEGVLKNGLTARETLLEPMYVIWPNGRSGSPRFWTHSEAVIHLPNGVLDSSISALAKGDSDARILPPISLWKGITKERTVPENTEGEDDSIEVQGLPDTNEDEG